MNIALIGGSPKEKQSASAEILAELKHYLSGHATTEYAVGAEQRMAQDALEAIVGQDAIVFAFPLYVDGIPSNLLRVLSRLEPLLRERKSMPLVYAVANCGFYEGRQNAHALDMMKIWCEKANARWGRGVGVGGGGMLAALGNVPYGQGPRKNISNALRALAQSIDKDESGPDLFTEPSFPRFLYKTMAQWGWRRQIRGNGLTTRDLSLRR